jgi:hypothetical protein
LFFILCIWNPITSVPHLESAATFFSSSYGTEFLSRKEKKGGDVLAWMSRRANVNVRVFLEGKERILDRAMYKMKLLAAEDSDSSEDERQRHDSKR